MVLDLLRLELSLPKPLLLLPEATAGIALLLALRTFASQRRLMIGPGFSLWFVAMFLFLALGLVASEATTGPIVGGVRFYLKYMPFFLIPIVYQFTDRQLRIQLLVVLGFSLLQAPIAMLQRFVFYAGQSGDEARGTFATGSMSAVFLLMTLSILVASYHKKVMSLAQLLVCGSLIFIPMSIGEVKGAFLLLPLALVIPSVLMPDGRGVGRKLARSGIVATAALVLFASVYGVVESNFRPTQRNGSQSEHRTSIIAFFTNPDTILDYLAPRLKAEDGEHDRSGRIDDLVAPISTLTEHPIRWVTGLGMGGVTEAPVDAFSTDQHAHLLDEGVVGSSMSVLLWELGILGTTLVTIGAIMVWRSAKVARFAPGLEGAIGLGWLAAVPIFFIALFWKNILGNDPITLGFAYFTGHVLAIAYRQRNPQTQASMRPFEGAPLSQRAVYGERASNDTDQGDDSMLPPILHTASSMPSQR